jgi:SAM-dependent methyltransferase
VTGFIILILTVSALLFAAKLLYLFSTACVLPLTQGALYVSTARCRIEAVFSTLTLMPGTRLVDLGCGDGRVLRIARRCGAGQAEGYELNPLAYLKARLLSIRDRGITIRHQNFWEVDLGNADVVCCYLFPDVMARLALKLKRELRPGTMVISFNFPLPGLTPGNVLHPGHGRHNDPIFLYRFQPGNPE